MEHFRQNVVAIRDHLRTNPCHRLLFSGRRALRFLGVFILLLCVVETLMSLAVYLGYDGGAYLQRVRWHKDGSLSFAHFQEKMMKPRFAAGTLGGDAGTSDSSGVETVVATQRVLPYCPLVPSGLKGPVKVNLKPPPSFWPLEATFSVLQPGGRYTPPTCRPTQKVALIIPYRDRRVHLKIFLRNMHPFLQKQQLDYTIFVIELKEGVDFNRALLFNVGYTEALKVDNFTCFIFHDVDLLPEDDRNLYRCSTLPRHMSVAVDRLNYKLPYITIFGGASALSRQHFQQVNGFSNVYFGWGGEDDDMYRRIRSHGLKVVRYTGDVARYKSMGHAKAVKSPSRLLLLRQGPKRFLTDGLNSLKYSRLDFEQRPLYTWVLVDVDQKAIMASAEKTLLPRIRTRRHALRH